MIGLRDGGNDWDCVVETQHDAPRKSQDPLNTETLMDNAEELSGYGVAIVGMAIRVPGALNPDAYWGNLKQGVESVKFYTDEELLLQGVAADLLKNPNYVKAGCPLEGMQQFDPEFFGFSPKEVGKHLNAQDTHLASLMALSVYLQARVWQHTLP